MDETKALAAKRKALSREVLRLKRESTRLREQFKAAIRPWSLSEKLKQAEEVLLVAKAQLATFDRDAMDD